MIGEMVDGLNRRVLGRAPTQHARKTRKKHGEAVESRQDSVHRGNSGAVRAVVARRGGNERLQDGTGQ